MAGMGGFEPPHDGIKNRCLTAWLHPNRERAFYTVNINFQDFVINL
jgi:hypothetical protein